MTQTFDISEIREATRAARHALASAWVPPSVELDPDAFTLYESVPALSRDDAPPAPLLQVTVTDRRASFADGPRNADETTIKIRRHPDLVAGGSYNSLIAREIFRADCEVATARQKREITLALTSLGRMAKLCGETTADAYYARATGLGKKALASALTPGDFRAICGKDPEGSFECIIKSCGTWMLTTPREGEKPFVALSVLTVASAAALLMAGLLRASRQSKWKNEAPPALYRLSAAAAGVGIQLLQERL